MSKEQKSDDKDKALHIGVVSKCDCPPLVACKICGEIKNLMGIFGKTKRSMVANVEYMNS